MAAAQIGPCVVKAQVPTGKRGKAGGIKLANTPAEAEQVAGQILGMTIGDYKVERAADRAAGQDRARVLRRGAARHRRAQAADFVLHRRRHGYRGDRGREARRHPPAAGRHRQRAACARHRRHAQGPGPWRRGSADRPDHRSSLPRLPHPRRRVAGDQSAGLARRRPRRGARLQIRARRRRALSPARSRQGRLAGGDDRPRKARRRSRAQADPARRQCRRAGERRRPHHDDHGRDPPLRRQAGELPRNRRRGLHQVGDRARPSAVQSRRQKPGDQFLRRLRPHRRDGRRRGESLAQAEAEGAGVLLHPRHRRGRSRQAGARATRHRTLRFHGRRHPGSGEGGDNDRSQKRPRRRARHHRQAGHVLDREDDRLRHQCRRRCQSQARGRKPCRRAHLRLDGRGGAKSRRRRRGGCSSRRRWRKTRPCRRPKPASNCWWC